MRSARTSPGAAGHTDHAGGPRGSDVNINVGLPEGGDLGWIRRPSRGLIMALRFKGPRPASPSDPQLGLSHTENPCCGGVDDCFFPGGGSTSRLRM